MATACEISNEEVTPEGKIEMPVLREMLNDINESTGSPAQSSNSSLPADDLLVTQAALTLTALQEHDELSVDEAGNTNDVNNSSSENLLGALNSSGKRFSIALNNAASQDSIEPEENLSGPTPVIQTPVQQIDNTQQTPAQQPSVRTTIPINQPRKKQHIMISYNRSCEDDCRKIRNSLKALKYKVWMDVFDIHDNFIDEMAKAIRNSYIVLICINRNYDSSYWCKKEIQDVAIKRIKFIPCFMEKPLELADWLDFLVSGDCRIDFSDVNEYDKSFTKLIGEITSIEEKLATFPRETPPTTPIINSLTTITVNPTVEESFDMIMRNFKTWVEDNRDDLKRLNRNQSSQLINQLLQGLQGDHTTPGDQNKNELLQQLLSSTTKTQNRLIPQMFGNLNESNYPLIKSLLFIMALWAVRVVFKKD